MTDRLIRVTEQRSGLEVTYRLRPEKAPASVAFLWKVLDVPRDIPGIHAMWTGPEISCPIPDAYIGHDRDKVLPQENATITPAAGDLIFAYVPAHMWAGNPTPVFDIGLFYGPGGRMLFPIGWYAGSVIGEVMPEQREALADACCRIRRSGEATLTFERLAA